MSRRARGDHRTGSLTRDGGIDAVYLFANGDLIQEDTDTTQYKRGVQLELVITQATTSAGFS